MYDNYMKERNYFLNPVEQAQAHPIMSLLQLVYTQDVVCSFPFFWSSKMWFLLLYIWPCSAGVGRTGTFICIDNVLEQVKKENMVDIAGVINKMRHQRMKMVQTPVGIQKCVPLTTLYRFLQEQYIFIHDGILESLTCGDTEISSANLRLALKKMNKVNQKDNMTPLQTQFKVDLTIVQGGVEMKGSV